VLNATQPNDVTQVIQLGNSGTAPLQVAWSGLAAPFSVDPAPSTILPGNSQAITLRCSGATAGVFNTSQIVLTTNDPARPTVSWNAQCTVGSQPSAAYRSTPAAPGPLSLATTTGSPASVGLVVFNDGNSPLQVTSLTGLSAPLSVSPTSATVGNGGSQPFTVTCNSPTLGSFSQSLVVQTSAGSFSYSVECQVTAVSTPEFSSVPASPGPVTIATTQNVSGIRTIQLRNAGTGALSISFPQPGGVFSVAPAGPFTLGAGVAQDLAVTCLSTSVGAFNGTLTLSTNDSNEATVPFNLGCTVAANQPEFSSTPAAPGPLAITTQAGTPANTTLAIQNLGSAALSIAGFSGLAAPFSISPPSATIPPSATQNFSVTCSPASAGLFTDDFLVSTNDGDEGSVAFSARCEATQFPPEFNATPAPGTAVNQSAIVGSSSQATITVSNQAVQSPATLVVATSGLTGVLAASPAGFSIASGTANRVVTVTCAPTAVGTTTQVLRIDSNDPNEATQTWPVSCTGAQAVGPVYDSNFRGPFTVIITPPAIAPSFATMRVRNAGVGVNLSINLSINPVTPGATFAASPTSASIAPAQVRDFLISCSPTGRDRYTATLIVQTNDPGVGTLLFEILCVPLTPPVTNRGLRRALQHLYEPPPVFLFQNGFE
jgi:hypothetical protein